ncbi:NADPH-dependent F420 reductase [Streptomyces boluensis]|uniref:NAD(P)-binding domain-containing protein n=1 Tax=Streptomyces boluensis TaxID=1775135 RepID=A0A964UP77_9ACTN|nr:NAD(P)-binding domain-containing protein [Streptomyces boluensis]NBE51448.1 NAD(P)-binding domain-containing protein [Streptomyces boluensis]
MRIGILGTGNVGKAVGHAAAAAGHDVVFGSRTPEAPHEGIELPVVGVREAAAHGELVVNATGGNASLGLPDALGDALDDTVLLDIAIDLTPDLGLVHQDASLAEQLQRALPRAKVVKSLCTMDSVVMAHPEKTLSGPSSVFLSGDDAAAKSVVEDLLADLGWADGTRIDLGGLATARGQEHLALLFIGLATGLGHHTFNLRVVTPE